MTRLELVKHEVHILYTVNNPEADPWNPWGYPHHVLVVAKNAEKLAHEHQASEEICVSAALLHDIADVIMPRAGVDHESKSLQLAGEILDRCNFAASEKEFIIQQVLIPHRCRSVFPTTLEGKIVATADATSHFQTDFYPYFAWYHYGSKEYPNFKQWLLEKIEKDFHKKIFFDAQRKEIEPDYQALKRIFSK